MAVSRPDDACMSTTTGSMPSSACGGWCTTRSGPSATISRSSSVIRVAISTMTCRSGSRPVISRSIHEHRPRIDPAPADARRVGRCSACPSGSSIPTWPLPSYARVGDAGADLVAREGAVLAPGGGRALVPTGIALALPPGTAGFVQPRSGLALRHGVTCLNTPGLIDSGYRDELKVLLVNLDPSESFEVVSR